jgi:hypothetical protein
MVTSISLRRGVVRVKNKTSASSPAPGKGATDKGADGDGDASDAEFSRRPAFRARRKSGRSDWRMAAAIFGFLAFLAAGIYALGQTFEFDSTAGTDRSREQSAAAGSGNMAYPTRGEAGFLPGRGRPGDTSWGSLANYSAPTPESFRTTFGGLRKSSGQPTSASASAPAPATVPAPAAEEASGKLVLQDRLSGNCVIGVNGIRDLRDCLVSRSTNATGTPGTTE